MTEQERAFWMKQIAVIVNTHVYRRELDSRVKIVNKFTEYMYDQVKPEVSIDVYA